MSDNPFGSTAVYTGFYREKRTRTTQGEPRQRKVFYGLAGALAMNFVLFRPLGFLNFTTKFPWHRDRSGSHSFG